MTAPDTRAGRGEWIALGVLLLPVLLISMDMTILYFAVPYISADLAPTGTQQLWIVDIYAFVLAGLLITMGALGDRIGRRRLLMIGAGAFGVASLAAAYADSPGMLIAARALLGVAGATLMPSTLALIRNLFLDPAQRRTAVAIWTAGFSGGAALGPLVSGALLEHFWWGSVFLINVPVMVALLVSGPLLLPEFRNPVAGRFDLVGAALSLAAVLPAVYGIKEIAVDGTATLPVLAIAAGVALAVAFLHRERAGADPMIDVRLFRNPAFSASMTVNVLAMFAMVGFALFTTQYLQSVLGMDPFEAALWTLPAPLSVGVGATLAALLARRVRPAAIIAGGLAIAVAGFALMTQVQVGSRLSLVLAGATLLAAGIGIALTLTADMIMSAAPPERAGAAAAVSETGNELGGALGVAILGSIGAAAYRSDMAGATPGAARDTLGGAQAAAAGLPGQAGSALLHAAREAFTHGMHAAAVAGAIVMLAAAVSAVVLLRDVRAEATVAAPDAQPAPA